MSVFRIAWRGKWWILLCMTVALFLGGYYAFRVADHQFRSSTVLRFEKSDAAVLDLAQLVSGSATDGASLNTELEAISTREMIEKLVIRLNLTEDPEFNSRLRPPAGFTPVATLKQLLGLSEDPPELTEEELYASDLRRTTGRVRAAISVTPERETFLFRITAVSLRPEVAPVLANTLAEIYIETKLEERIATAEAATSWLSGRVQSLEAQVQEQEDKLQEYQTSTSFFSPEALEALRFRAKELQDRLDAQQDNLLNEQRILDGARDAIARKDKAELLSFLNDPILRRSANALGQDLSGPERAQREFEAGVALFLSRSQSNVDRLTAEVESLSETIAELQDQIAVQNRDMQVLNQIERELAVTRDLYRTMLTGLQEVSMQIGLVRSDTSILSRALPPNSAFAPRRSIIVLLSVALGAIFGLVILLLRELSQHNIRSAAEVARITDIPVLAELPILRVGRRESVLSYYQKNPVSPAAEALRNLRTSLLMSQPEDAQQVFMITSSVPGESKTTLTLSLAQNFAGMNKRVLAIEADIRRRPFAGIFPQNKPEHGLTDVISGQARLEDAVVFQEDFGISLLFGDKTNINAADLFSSVEFDNLIRTARQQFDYIIIDTPPVLLVPDARIIAASADAVMYAARWNTIAPEALQEGLSRFSSVNTRIAGVVLTQVDIRRMNSYRGRGYYQYGYNNGYGKEKSYDI